MSDPTADTLRLNSGGELSLEGTHRSMRLDSGAVNLFLEVLEKGRRKELLFLCTRKSGEILLCTSARISSEGIECRLLAVASEPTLLHPLGTALPGPEEIDAWCESLLSGLVLREGTGTSALQFDRETAELEVPEGGALRSAGGILWAGILSGSVRHEGFPETLKQGSGSLILMTPRCSITAVENAVLKLHRTVSLLPDSIDRALSDFHARTVLEHLEQHRENARRRIEDERYDEIRCGFELRNKLRALRGLIGIVREEKKRNTEQDPLLLALRTIAADHHLEFTVPVTDRKSRALPERLRDLVSGNRWRMRKVHLPENFRKFFSGTVLGFYGPEGIPAAIRLRGHRSSWIRPEDGSEQPLSAEDASRFSSAAYRFYEQFPDRKMTRKDLALFALDGLAQVGRRIVFLGICIGLLGFVLPIATEYLAGQIIPTANTLELRQLTVLLLSLTFATALLGLAPQVSLLAYGAHQTERFQAALFDHILNVKIDFFRQYNTGELCTRLLSAIRIQETVFAVLSGQFLGALFSLSSLVMLFVYSWRLALLALFLNLIYCLLMSGLFLLNRRPLARAAAANGRLAGMLKQFLDGIAKIRGAGAEKRVISRYLDDYLQLTRADRAMGRNGARTALLDVLFPAGTALVFFLFAGNFWRGEMTLPEFLAFLCAYGCFQQGVAGSFSGFWRLASIRPEIERLMPLIEAETERGKAQQPGELNGSVELSNVTFHYSPEGPAVLQNVSIRANAGEFIAIVGPSGAGKSSLMRLLLGFEQPETGTVFYNGRDLSTLDVHAVRRQLGVILQNSRVMPGTILDNIVTGSGCTRAEAERAAQLAALDRDLKEMPMGLYTMVSEELISGGQQQRILIARALVGNPAVILMDEATHALDSAAEEQIRRNMERLPVTRILIAQRLSTVVNADRIYVLNKGRVEQCGTCRELLAQDGLFRELAERQMLYRESETR